MWCSRLLVSSWLQRLLKLVQVAIQLHNRGSLAALVLLQKFILLQFRKQSHKKRHLDLWLLTYVALHLCLFEERLQFDALLAALVFEKHECGLQESNILPRHVAQDFFDLAGLLLLVDVEDVVHCESKF